MTDRDYAAERYREDTADHVMTVELDNGVHRSLCFANPESFHAHFRINTWPGHLCITGDMGCFVFARLKDMFQFFRGDRINPDYWSQKLVGEDRDGFQCYCDKTFAAAIRSDFDQWDFDDEETKAAAWKEIEEDLLSRAEEFQQTGEAIQAAMDFRSLHTEHDFDDFYEHRLTKYTFRFLWACHAIVDAIRQYDELAKAASTEAAAAETL